MQNMAQFLNDSVPGITVTVEKGEKPDYSRLVITSDRTGQTGPQSFYFDDDEIFREGAVDFFGLNRMEKAPSNAEFELNGIKKQTSTNTFSIENTIQVTLKGTGKEPVGINVVPDKNPIMKSVDSFLGSFNELLGLAKSRTEEVPEHFGPSKLINEIKKLEQTYRDELEANGFSVSEYGMLSLDDALAVQSCEDGGMESLFTRENGFIARILDKTEAITINPLEYLDKKVVTYPNSAKTAFANPYVTSMYSGLLFNSYC
jgi:flagellar hook-associated protein 2